MKPTGAARRLPLYWVLPMLVAACATGSPGSWAPPPSAEVAGFAVGEDSFAFPNDVRRLKAGSPDLYANYCFVLARGVRQFYSAARFEPALPRLSDEQYLDRVRRVVTHAAWEAQQPPDDRVVFPGYRNLGEFSSAHEGVVKQGLGGRFWSWVHWTNWRVTVPVSGGHQEQVALEIMMELAAGRLVQLLVTNWPMPELNHTVVAYEYRAGEASIDFTVYDPNDPVSAGVVSFDRERRQFWASRLFDTRPGKIRAFRMYYSPLL